MSHGAGVSRIEKYVEEVCSLEQRRLHGKVRINACFDVPLLLACSHHCGRVLGIRKSLRGATISEIAALAFSLLLFRMLDGPACMIALHDVSKTWVVPLQRAFSSDALFSAACHTLQVALTNVHSRCAVVGEIAKWLVGGLRLNAQHTGYGVVKAAMETH